MSSLCTRCHLISLSKCCRVWSSNTMRWKQPILLSKKSFTERKRESCASLKTTNKRLSLQKHTIWCPSIKWSSSKWKIYFPKSLVPRNTETGSANKMLSIVSKEAPFWETPISTTKPTWSFSDYEISLPTNLLMPIKENYLDKRTLLSHNGRSKLDCQNVWNPWKKLI